MPFWIIGWLLGTSSILLQTSFPARIWATILLACGIISALFLITRTQRLSLFITGGCFAAAYTLIRLSGNVADQSQLEDWLAQHPRNSVQLVGTVNALPQQKPDYSTIVLAVETSYPKLPTLPTRIRLTATQQPGQPAPTWQAGERWQVTVRLKSIQTVLNPGVQDKTSWLYREGIMAQASLISQHAKKLGEDASLPAALLRWRATEKHHIEQQLSTSAQAGIITALTIGDQQAIPDTSWTLFRQTGITHLVSISGLHITLFAWLTGVSSRWIWRRSARLCAWQPAPKIALIGGLLMATVYTLLSGWSIPAQRTLYMLLAAGLIRLGGWHIRVAGQLQIALWIILLIDPLALLSPGFWLSFGAVATLLWVGDGYLIPPGKLRLWWHTQWGLFLLLAPILVLLFQQLSLIAPLANLIAVPVVSLIITPLALAGLVLPTCLSLAAWLMDKLFNLLLPLGQVDFASHSFASPGLTLTILATFGAIWSLAPRGWPLRWLGFTCLLPIFVTPKHRPQAGEMHVVVLDVGQGLAVHVQTHTHDLIFDTGAAWGKRDSGTDILLPYLQQEGITQLSALVVSHDDNDHSGGARSLLRGISVDTLYSSLLPTHPINRLHSHPLPCLAGNTWQWDKVTFRFLSPYPDQDINDGDNHRSCVLQIKSSSGNVMIPADAEWQEEQRMLANDQATDLQSDVLIAGHHGSRTSSSAAWVNTIKAKDVIMTAGRHNRYGHPHKEVVSRFQASGARIWTSAQQGAISMDFSEGQYTVRSERSDHARFWHASDH